MFRWCISYMYHCSSFWAFLLDEKQAQFGHHQTHGTKSKKRKKKRQILERFSFTFASEKFRNAYKKKENGRPSFSSVKVYVITPKRKTSFLLFKKVTVNFSLVGNGSYFFNLQTNIRTYVYSAIGPWKQNEIPINKFPSLESIWLLASYDFWKEEEGNSIRARSRSNSIFHPCKINVRRSSPSSFVVVAVDEEVY